MNSISHHSIPHDHSTFAQEAVISCDGNLTRCRDQRDGFSLLEVLVACGILVVGLAGVAAMLPAAGSRLAEAALYDRAAATVGVAMSEVVLRNVVAAKCFVKDGTAATTTPVAAATPDTPIGVNMAIVFGEVLKNIPTLPSPPSTIALGSATFLASRFDMGTGDTRRGFFLEDEIQYESPPKDVPQRSAIVDGLYPFKRGVCWGAMVSPYPWGTNPTSMTKARVTIAVFRKPGDIQKISLTKSAPTSSVYKMATADESLRKHYLKGCSWVLSAAGATTEPKWLSINSSWQSGSDSFVIFRESTVASDSLDVIGFEGLLHVTEQIIVIQ